jgi:LacI family transcriptional regulator
MGKRATIKDVAKRAGVSATTVSFVLNKPPGQTISQPVQARVLKAAADLDYHPTAAAAGLARKHSYNVAIVFYRNEQLMTNQFYSFVVQGAVKEALENGYNLLFSYIPDEYSASGQLPKVILERNAEGALFIQEVQAQLVADVCDRGVAAIAVDSHPHVPGLESIRMDNREGGRLATQHLLDLGHEHVVFLRAAEDRPSIAERSAAFRETVCNAGLPFAARSSFVRAADISHVGAYKRALAMLAGSNRPTGVFCANDEMALGVLRAAYDLHLRVPEDLSVVGFDDIFTAQCTTPTLTTIGIDKELMGRRAMARLLQLVAGSRGRPSQALARTAPPQDRNKRRRSGASGRSGRKRAAGPSQTTQEALIPVELVVRASTGPAPRPGRLRAKR